MVWADGFVSTCVLFAILGAAGDCTGVLDSELRETAILDPRIGWKGLQCWSGEAPRSNHRVATCSFDLQSPPWPAKPSDALAAAPANLEFRARMSLAVSCQGPWSRPRSVFKPLGVRSALMWAKHTLDVAVY
jgi:hypothetical protein